MKTSEKVVFVPEHFNHNANCFIDEYWMPVNHHIRQPYNSEREAAERYDEIEAENAE